VERVERVWREYGECRESVERVWRVWRDGEEWREKVEREKEHSPRLPIEEEQRFFATRLGGVWRGNTGNEDGKRRWRERSVATFTNRGAEITNKKNNKIPCLSRFFSFHTHILSPLSAPSTSPRSLHFLPSLYTFSSPSLHTLSTLLSRLPLHTLHTAPSLHTLSSHSLSTLSSLHTLLSSQFSYPLTLVVRSRTPQYLCTFSSPSPHALHTLLSSHSPLCPQFSYPPNAV